MSTLKKAYEAQINNIQVKTGKTLDELRVLAKESGLVKHGELRAMFQQVLGLGHGDANSLIHALFESDGMRAAAARSATLDDVLSEIYRGPKAGLRPMNDALFAEIDSFGEFERVPKKGYISLRRKKQFAMIGPANRTQIEVGLNMKDLDASERLVAMAPGGMCQYRVRVAVLTEIDAELIGWIRQAYEAAG